MSRRVLSDLDSIPVSPGPGALYQIVDRLNVEISRGTTRGCRYCQAGVLYLVRERRPEAVLDWVDRAWPPPALKRSRCSP